MKPEDLSIILFKGAGQYDVTNRFIDDMENGYRLHDQKVCTFDLTGNFENTRKSLIDLLERGRPMFALGINAMGQFYVKDKSIYDLVAFPHISWFVDHPVHHLNRLELPVEDRFRQDHLADHYGFMAVVDEEHKTFIDASFGNEYGTFFLPHGGCESKNFESQERSIDIIFCGTGFSPNLISDDWKKLSPNEQKLLNLAVEIDVKSDQLSVMQVVTKLFEEQNLQPDRNLFMSIMQRIERHSRARNRMNILNQLDKAGVVVNIYGNKWEFANFKNHKLHKPVSFDESLDLLRKSKLSLNISSFFTNGSHERIFSSMLNGAVPLTNTSKYLNNLSGFEELVLCYNDENIVEVTRCALGDSKFFDHRSVACIEFAKESHTFAHRAIEVRDLIANVICP